MNVQEAYDQWAEQYDSCGNPTRDLEGVAIREVLNGILVGRCLEIGCGTGKNTQWLATISSHVTAVDLSAEMLQRAKEKLNGSAVEFVQADITGDWNFGTEPFDLVTFSLVLEHIKNLNHIFHKVKQYTHPGSLVYVGELHPFKQYTGTKARFDTPQGVQVVNCFNHHISDFTSAAISQGFRILDLKEYFDPQPETCIPRIMALLLMHP